jgi:hypothetical protein
VNLKLLPLPWEMRREHCEVVFASEVERLLLVYQKGTGPAKMKGCWFIMSGMDFDEGHLRRHYFLKSERGSPGLVCCVADGGCPDRLGVVFRGS